MSMISNCIVFILILITSASRQPLPRNFLFQCAIVNTETHCCWNNFDYVTAVYFVLNGTLVLCSVRIIGQYEESERKIKAEDGEKCCDMLLPGYDSQCHPQLPVAVAICTRPTQDLEFCHSNMDSWMLCLAEEMWTGNCCRRSLEGSLFFSDEAIGKIPKPHWVNLLISFVYMLIMTTKWNEDLVGMREFPEGMRGNKRE